MLLKVESYRLKGLAFIVLLYRTRFMSPLIIYLLVRRHVMHFASCVSTRPKDETLIGFARLQEVFSDVCANI